MIWGYQKELSSTCWCFLDDVRRDRARPFLGGPVLLARLAPVDYHHLHYPDNGSTLDHYWLGRRLWTVNWHALQSEPDILFGNTG